MASSIVLLKQTMAIHIKTHRNMDTGETFLAAYEETIGWVRWHLPHKPGDQSSIPEPRKRWKEGITSAKWSSVLHMHIVLMIPTHAENAYCLKEEASVAHNQKLLV